MDITEKIIPLIKKYVPIASQFSYGVAFPFAATTSWRKGNEEHTDLLRFYKRRVNRPDDENFKDYFMESGRRDLYYVIGLMVGILGAKALIDYGFMQIKSKADATVIAATLAALVAGNAASIIYERWRKTRQKFTIDDTAISPN